MGPGHTENDLYAVLGVQPHAEQVIMPPGCGADCGCW